MKKMMYLVTTTLMIMVGCETKQSCDLDQIKAKTSKSSLVSPSNSTNEYDYIGQRHNDSLLQLVTTFDPNLIDSEFIYNLYYYEGAPSFLDLESVLSQMNSNSDDYTGKMKTLFDNNTTLFLVLDDILDLIKSDINLQQKVNQIISYENSFDYSVLTSNQKIALKAMFSVARHSMVLWENENEGGIDLMSKGIQFKVNYIGGNQRTHNIVLADIWGTLGGALVGGPGGALFSGVWGSATYWLTS